MRFADSWSLPGRVRPPSRSHHSTSRAGLSEARFFLTRIETTMIASRQNEKLKLVRKLRERKHRDREGLFVTEGEDLLAAGLAAGQQPELLLTAPGARLGGEEVE